MPQEKGAFQTSADESIRGFITEINPKGTEPTIRKQFDAVKKLTNESERALNSNREKAEISATMLSYYQFLLTDAHTLYDNQKNFLDLLGEKLSLNKDQFGELEGDAFKNYPDVLIANAKEGQNIMNLINKLKHLSDALNRDNDEDDIQLADIINAIENLEKDKPRAEKFDFQAKLNNLTSNKKSGKGDETKVLNIQNDLDFQPLLDVLNGLTIAYSNNIAPQLSLVKSSYEHLSASLDPLKKDLQKNTDDLLTKDAEIQSQLAVINKEHYQLYRMQKSLSNFTALKTAIHKEEEDEESGEDEKELNGTIGKEIKATRARIKSNQELLDEINSKLDAIDKAEVMTKDRNEPIEAYLVAIETTRENIDRLKSSREDLVRALKEISDSIVKSKEKDDVLKMVIDFFGPLSDSGLLAAFDQKTAEVKQLNEMLGNVKVNSDIKEYLLKIEGILTDLQKSIATLFSKTLATVETQSSMQFWAEYLESQLSLKKAFDRSSYNTKHEICKDQQKLASKKIKEDVRLNELTDNQFTKWIEGKKKSSEPVTA